MRTSIYPIILTADIQQGRFVVIFRDVTEAVTKGDDIPEALLGRRLL